MKLNYHNIIESTTLDKISYGELFRLINSQRVFMKTSHEANEDLFNECESRLMDYYENPQYKDWDSPYAIAVCIDMESGQIVLFNFEVQVIQLNYVLEVEE